MRTQRFAFACVASLFSLAVNAQNFADARIDTQQLGEGMYVFFGVGEDVVAGNILASIGSDGVLIVDTQFPEMVPKYRAKIAEFGGGAIDFAINTHWHFDHANGNQVLGPAGVKIVAQDVSRSMLMHDNVINLVDSEVQQPTFPEEARPAITYGSAMSLHFNDQLIDLRHYGPGHTMGDSAVYFRERGIVHLGDVFNTSGYPFIDADNGGSLAGVIDFCSAVLAELPRTAIVIPGHGPISDYNGLVDYIAMLSEIRDRMSALISSGATLEQVKAARITAEWDAAKGDPTRLLDRAYASMTRRASR